jgi:hypothetical protein
VKNKIEANKAQLDRLRIQCIEDIKQRGREDISSDNCAENETVFKFMKFQQRKRHMKVMWLKAFTKAKAGV